MSSLAVRVEGIGKQYQLGLREKRHQTFREAVVDMAAAPMRRLRHLSGRAGSDDTFWALKDISFDVPEGEVLGIIGHNGAGKSTLLKILSRITEPTEGRATIHGRVASLLEVGTGFHNELTGRENVYLNGAILGMSRREIDRKFDEIVDFAGVEKFLDTPIKRYSSGMKVRLAFAVAAHLDPEILIIDEVLAVGDQEFQKKCLGKMQDVATSGRTVLFVSHNMAAVQNLCERVLVLKAGHTHSCGESDITIARYLEEASAAQETSPDLASRHRPDGFYPIIQRVTLLDEDSQPTNSVRTCGPARFRIDYSHFEEIPDAFFGLRCETVSGTSLFWVQTRLNQGPIGTLPASGHVDCDIPMLPLIPGQYEIHLGCGSRTVQLDRVTKAMSFTVTEDDVFGTGRLPQRSHGFFVLNASWSTPRTILASATCS